MNKYYLKIIVVIIFVAFHTFAVKVYENLNMSLQNITNVPTPIADNNAVNREHIEKLVEELYIGTNLSVAVPAKCGKGQISGYTPVAGEDLYADMQFGVDWNTNTRFDVVSAGSNVYDTLTGLMWTQNANMDGQKSRANAITYCNGLVWGGYSDWRLPNINELNSLVDLSEFNPVLPNGHPFSDVQADIYWSSSSVASDTSQAWYVDMEVGTAIYSAKSSIEYVWAVRSGI